MTIDKKNTFAGILLVIILLAFCLVFTHFLMPGAILPTRFFVSRLSFWVVVGILFIYAAKIERRPLLLWGEQWHKFIFYPVSIVAILGATLVGGFVIAMVIRSFGLSVRSNKVGMILGFSLQLRLLAVVTAAVTEELIVRGYLLPRLQLFFKKPVWPIVISSFIFSLAHMGFGTFINMAVPFWIGLVFAWHYYKYRNLTILIICHFLIDFISIIIPHTHK